MSPSLEFNVHRGLRHRTPPQKKHQQKHNTHKQNTETHRKTQKHTQKKHKTTHRKTQNKQNNTEKNTTQTQQQTQTIPDGGPYERRIQIPESVRALFQKKLSVRAVFFEALARGIPLPGAWLSQTQIHAFEGVLCVFCLFTPLRRYFNISVWFAGQQILALGPLRGPLFFVLFLYVFVFFVCVCVCVCVFFVFLLLIIIFINMILYFRGIYLTFCVFVCCFCFLFLFLFCIFFGPPSEARLHCTLKYGVLQTFKHWVMLALFEYFWM